MSTLVAKLAAAVAFVAAAAGPAAAAETATSVVLTPVAMTPVKALVFDIGSKRAVSYYQPTGGACNLTVVMAERSNEDGAVGATPSRVSVAVLAGKTARIDTAEGKALEFACEAAGAEMTVKAVEQVAWTPKAPKG